LFKKLRRPFAGQASKASSSGGGALKAVILVPYWHIALLFLATDMRGDAGEGFVLHAGTEVTMPVVRAFDRRMVWGRLETLVAEYGLLKAWVSIQGVAFVGGCLGWVVSWAVGRSLARTDGKGVSLVWSFMRGGFCEHLFD
jgi:hypothetical protein